MTEEKSKSAKLTILPTPIGNLDDITLRAIKALESADAIYSEDTRVTQKLISALGLDVHARVFRLDENTMAANAHYVADAVAKGENVVYCTDAGMPGVSDPGLRLVAYMRESGFTVEVLPGASAAIVAYVLSGTDNPHFYFGGFLPRKEAKREVALKDVADLDAALIFYESPNRLVRTLQTIASVFPYRNVSVCRELTKLHEEVCCGTASDIAAEFSEREESGIIKGECVVVIDGPLKDEIIEKSAGEEDEALACARRLLDEGLSSKSIVLSLIDQFDISKNRAYEIVLSIKGDVDGK